MTAAVLRCLKADEIGLAQSLYHSTGRAIDDAEWQALTAEIVAGQKKLVLAQNDTGLPIGLGLLNFKPQYAPFQRLNIPEIQDLLVHPDHRRQGLGAALIHFCEYMAKDAHATDIGISFGLDASYGAAQRLYVRLGYLPDGNGAVYNREVMLRGQMRPLDDYFCLMLLKSLT